MSLLRRRLLEQLSIEKKEVLPEGYIRLDYIESTGTQWIDTGFIANDSSGLYAKFMATAIQDSAVIGSKGTGDARFAITQTIKATEFRINLSWNSTYGIKGDYEQNKILEATINYKNDRKRIANGFIARSISDPLNKQPYSVCLFGAKWGSDTISVLYTGRIYHAQITNENSIIFNFLPCINPSGSVGMFDTVGGRFYGNQGSGKFIPGYHLPDGYTILEYIESTGTQYIDTGVIPKSTDCISINCIISEDKFNKVMFGSRTSGNYMTSKNQIYLNENSSQFTMFFGTNAMNLHGLFDTATSRVINGLFDVKNKKIANRNNANFIAASSDFDNTATQPYYLFALNNCGKAGVFISMKLFSVTIWDNDKKVRDFIPCINDKGVVGLYDIIDDKFYGNMGTGKFLEPNSTQEVTVDVV